jgi:hypothetical protein
MFLKESFDQDILGIFFSLAKANQCAKAYVRDELGHGIDDDSDEDNSEEAEEDHDDDDDSNDDDDDSNGSDDSDCDEEFAWEDENYEGHEFDKVWVESYAIGDASRKFHK